MNEVKQEIRPTEILLKVVDNKTGETSYQVLHLNETAEDRKKYLKEEWEELTQEEKEKWGIK